MSVMTFGGAPTSGIDDSFGWCLFGTVQIILSHDSSMFYQFHNY